MRKTETAEGRSVRLLRVGEQVRHVLSDVLARGDVHDDTLSSHMVSVTEAGAIVCPPLPAFYLRPQSVADIVDFSVARALDVLDVPHTLTARWAGQTSP